MNNCNYLSIAVESDDDGTGVEDSEEPIVASSKTELYSKWSRKAIDNKERLAQRINTEFLYAIENGNGECFQKCLSNGACINAVCRGTGLSTCHVAALCGECHMLTELLNKDADCLMASWHGGILPLHYAAWKGCLSCIKLLLERDPNTISAKTDNEKLTNTENYNVLELDSWDHDHEKLNTKVPHIEAGSTILHIVCKRLHCDCVEYLLKNKSDVNATDSRGMTALNVINQDIITEYDVDNYSQNSVIRQSPRHSGCRSNVSSKLYDLHGIETASTMTPTKKSEDYCKRIIGNDECDKLLKIFSLLTEHGAIIESMVEDTRDSSDTKKCKTLLHTAVIAQNTKLIKLLLQKKVNYLIRNEDGDLPIHVAVKGELKKALISLVNNVEEVKEMLEVKDENGKTSLQIAISMKWNLGASILLAAGASVLAITSKGESVLHLAAEVGNDSVLEELFTFPEIVQVMDSRNSNNETPLIIAVRSNNHSCVKRLIKFGVSMRSSLANNKNIVHLAAENGYVDILELILKKDTHMIEARTNDGETALHYAARHGHLDCTSLLLDCGSDSSCKTIKMFDKPRGMTDAQTFDFGGTPLHGAAGNGHVAVVELLVKYNKKLINEVNYSGWYPLHTAAYFNHAECVECIVKNGGNLAHKVPFFNCRPKSAIDILCCSLNDPIEFFENLLNTYMETTTDLPINHPDYTVTFFYDILMPNGIQKKQMKVLNALLNNDDELFQQHLLQHPLIESFLYLKWDRLRTFFTIIMIMNGIFTGCLTIFAIHMNDSDSRTIQLITVILMFVFLAILLLNEVVHASKLQRYYLVDAESWIKWTTYGSALATGVCWWPLHPNRYAYLSHLAAVPVLLAWIEMLFLFARFPIWGFYVLMFFRVTANVIKVFFTFSFLIIGFVFSFYILLRDSPSFQTIWQTFVKVIAMMLEFDYSGIFEARSYNRILISEVVAKSIFLLFVILVAIVLMNLMIGLAVSDITTLEAQGRTQTLAKQIDFLNLLEIFAYSKKLLRYLPLNLQNIVKNNRTVSRSFTLYPGRPYDSKFKMLPIKLKDTIVRNILKRNNEKWNEDSRQKKI